MNKASLPFTFAGSGFDGTVHTTGKPRRGVPQRVIRTEDERQAFIEEIERDFIRLLAKTRSGK